MTRPALILSSILTLIAACGDVDSDGVTGDAAADPGAPDASRVPERLEATIGVQVRMDFAATDFWSAPWPSIHRQDVAGFPNPESIAFVDRTLALAPDEPGLTAGVFLSLSADIGPVDIHFAATVEDACPVGLVALDDGTRVPVTVDFRVDSGPHGPDHLLSLLPIQGIPLRPNTRYAAIVRADLTDPPLGRSETMAALLNGDGPADYVAAVAVLPEPETLAGLAVFETGDPTATMAVAVDTIRAAPLPTPNGPFEPQDVFDDYCVYQTTIDMPIYQRGEPPFTEEGGGWVLDEEGAPTPQGVETARIVATIPRDAAPESGFPVAVFVRTGGGGDRPLVDRGVRDAAGEVLDPGGGPARYFAAAGWAGLSIDGPHGGLRNVTGDDEQFLMFNVINPEALQDNVRQSALELVRFADVVETLAVDAADCPEVAGTVMFDPAQMALMGHSMGATIAPLVAANEPRYRAVVLSGSGGSWIENLVHKQSPLPVKGFAEAILQYGSAGYALHEHDPILSLVQWAGEGADSAVYGPRVTQHVLMFQGLLDTYIPPPIANATALSIGLDLAGDALDDGYGFTTLEEVLPLIGRSTIPLPATANRDGVTAVVVQHPEDGVEDGHEVMFQLPIPKQQYQHLLETLLSGPPTVPAGTAPARP